MATRRRLMFASLDDAVIEARRLLGGYDRAGHWTLAQNCQHLTSLMTASLDGFPMQPFPWLLRVTVGRMFKRQMLDPSKVFSAGMRGPKELMPPAMPGQDAEAVERFAEACARVQSATSFHASPFFGEATPAEWRLIHTHHAAHHLGFLVPTQTD